MSIAVPTFRTNLQPAQLPAVEVGGLYVHVPFCFHKCHYCDFYSITHQGPERMTNFVNLMLREAELWMRGEGPRVRPRTVFFGGGTPSLLPLEEMRRLIGGLRERIDCRAVEEWTVEANPATVSTEYCAMLREAGVNRLSFGAQSFNAAELKMLERHHDPEDVPRSIDIARACGFENLNLDLIYAVPGQDLASWEMSLGEVMKFCTPHVSCYGLTYEENTPMAVKKRLGRIRGVEEDVELSMMHHARARLSAAGLEAYEISNYALPGRECRHNLMYWTGGNYVALGPSGASHVEGWRWKNRPHLGEWERAVENDELPAVELEVLSGEQRAGELAMLVLRLSEGLRFGFFQEKTGMDARQVYSEVIERLELQGLVEVDHGGVRLSDRGVQVADAVAAEFLV
jgi:oxygen-independent coproporphyrinogen III oxidase